MKDQAPSTPDERELAIRARTAAGLPRALAEEVQDRQDAWDKEQAEAAKAASKKK